MADGRHSPLRALAAFEIGCLARQAPKPGHRGRVGAVYERSFYLSLAETEVRVGPPGLGAGPLNLRCHATGSVRLIPRSVGSQRLETSSH